MRRRIVIFNLGRTWRNPSKSHPIFLFTMTFLYDFLMSPPVLKSGSCFLFDYDGVSSLPSHVEEADTH